MDALKLQLLTAGPTQLIKNPAPRAYFAISTINLIIALLGLTALFYGNYVSTAYVTGLPYYLVFLAMLAWYSSTYFWKVSRMKELSVDEWFTVIIKGLKLNMVQVCIMIWGIYLSSKVVQNEHFIGSPMYFYLLVGKWMTNTILSLSLLNSICIISSIYIVLILTLSYILSQIFQNRFIR